MTQTDDAYGAIRSKIASFEGSTIPVPALSRLLGVKTTTLNARFRRNHISLRTIGRTNYVPHGLAMQLAELHRHALIGWPTLLDASKTTRIKAGTLKAWCEKGRLEGYIDLTKRLRLNPADVEKLRRGPQEAPAASECPGVASTARAKRDKSAHPAADHSAGHRFANRSAAKPAFEPPARPRFSIDDFMLPPAPEPEIDVIGPDDYGVPEPEMPAQREPPARRRNGSQQNGCLVYDPLHPFSLSLCSAGRTIRYGQYVGTILKVIDDPYTPMIKVAFPEHQHPAMREVLLVVDKKHNAALPG